MPYLMCFCKVLHIVANAFEEFHHLASLRTNTQYLAFAVVALEVFTSSMYKHTTVW